ncbi:MAG TPA: c-type cytochrome [Polyangiaceae bacterium]|nr:c-type cytochrome [Polyangiaceae bacterium]
MNPKVKKVLVGLGALVGGVLIAGGAYAYSLVHAFDTSVETVYSVPVPVLARSTDPAVIARGKHLAEAVASCATRDCHGNDGAGGKLLEIGPIGNFQGPNITPAGIAAVYTDGELARLVRHGIKKDGRTVRFMPVGDFTWLSDADVVAVISFVRSLPPVEKPNGPVKVGVVGKILDRRDFFPLDIARKIDHEKLEVAPAPEPTAAYGRFLVRLCTGCHGEHLAGGPIPGAPPSMPVPLNLTPHETGLHDWTYDDFAKLLATGIRKNGKAVDPMMPSESFGKMDDTEKHAIWEYLRTVPPLPFGSR